MAQNALFWASNAHFSLFIPVKQETGPMQVWAETRREKAA
jgi:hypothetical protein